MKIPKYILILLCLVLICSIMLNIHSHYRLTNLSDTSIDLESISIRYRSQPTGMTDLLGLFDEEDEVLSIIDTKNRKNGIVFFLKRKYGKSVLWNKYSGDERVFYELGSGVYDSGTPFIWGQ